MKVELKRLLYIFVGATGTIAMLNGPFVVQMIAIPIIGGIFGNAMYNTMYPYKEASKNGK